MNEATTTLTRAGVVEFEFETQDVFDLTHHWRLLSPGIVPGASFQVNIKNSHRQDLTLTQEEKREKPETQSGARQGSCRLIHAANC